VAQTQFFMYCSDHPHLLMTVQWFGASSLLVSHHWGIGSIPCQVFIDGLKFYSGSIIPLCCVLIIFYVPLLPEGQMAEAWES